MKICNVLATQSFAPRARDLSRGEDAIVDARGKLLISMTPRCRLEPTKGASASGPGNATTAPQVMLCEVAVLVEQAF